MNDERSIVSDEGFLNWYCKVLFRKRTSSKKKMINDSNLPDSELNYSQNLVFLFSIHLHNDQHFNILSPQSHKKTDASSHQYTSTPKNQSIGENFKFTFISLRDIVFVCFCKNISSESQTTSKVRLICQMSKRINFWRARSNKKGGKSKDKKEKIFGLWICEIKTRKTSNTRWKMNMESHLDF